LALWARPLAQGPLVRRSRRPLHLLRAAGTRELSL